tara:strand:- start:191 stop:328 length:138 start_codon:yes stop_codon:yes gene_type:complete
MVTQELQVHQHKVANQELQVQLVQVVVQVQLVVQDKVVNQVLQVQ